MIFVVVIMRQSYSLADNEGVHTLSHPSLPYKAPPFFTIIIILIIIIFLHYHYHSYYRHLSSLSSSFFIIITILIILTAIVFETVINAVIAFMRSERCPPSTYQQLSASEKVPKF